MRLAFDRATTVRRYDEFGRLHVAMTNISKATVNEYIGSEIPGAEELGLDPQRIYKLLRDPEELKKGAATFNGLPLLDEHIPHTAIKSQREAVCGSTGTDAVFEAPYLKNSLVVWTIESIAGIESQEQVELSSAYAYRPDMTPGSYEGVAYDGVMRDIVGNHVALVDVGRAGPDVIVADRLPVSEISQMKKKLSRRAVALRGALRVYLGPKLAQDARNIDVSPILAGVTSANFAKVKPKIVSDLTALLKGRLAEDANLESLSKLVDHFSDDPETEDDTAKDDMPLADKIKSLVSEHLSADEMAAMDEMFAAKSAADTAPEKPDGGAPKPGAMDKEDDEKMDKPAMDAALKASEIRIRAEQRALRDAEREVRPFVGELAVTMDSAEAVYEFCLKQRGVKIDGVPSAAFRHMVKMLPDPAAIAAPVRVAQDREGAANFSKRFPNTGRFTQAGG